MTLLNLFLWHMISQRMFLGHHNGSLKGQLACTNWAPVDVGLSDVPREHAWYRLTFITYPSQMVAYSSSELIALGFFTSLVFCPFRQHPPTWCPLFHPWDPPPANLEWCSRVWRAASQVPHCEAWRSSSGTFGSLASLARSGALFPCPGTAAAFCPPQQSSSSPFSCHTWFRRRVKRSVHNKLFVSYFWPKYIIIKINC